MDSREKFDIWMDDVNSLCEQRYGFDTSHFPDIAYRDYFHDELEAEDVLEILAQEIE